jgi:SNF2 family DNA or RNA helicase
MNRFSIDEFGNLVYEIIDSNTSDMLESGLETAEFKLKGNGVWIYPKTKDLRKENKIIRELIEFNDFEKIPLDVSEDISKKIELPDQDTYRESLENGLKIKTTCPVCEKKWDNHNENDKIACLTDYEPPISSKFTRELKPHQKLSVAQLLAISNGANFSVPGSGKTTITYAVLSKWLEDKIIDKILVIGPIASFAPWEDEYELCFGKPIKSKRIRGADNASNLSHLDHDLFLMHFTTASLYVGYIIEFLQKYNVALIIDESHNIKSPSIKTWARSVLALAPYARRRLILSGTPMPQNAEDLWTQFTFLWPYDNPLDMNHRYRRYAKNHGIGKYADNIKPLFTRVTKKDLGLLEPEFIPVTVPLSPSQQKIYNVIAAKTLNEINDLREQGRLHKFRAAKMIRLLQASSNPGLLYEKSDRFEIDGTDYGFADENVTLSPLSNIDESVYEQIVNYSKLKEIPSKLIEADKIARKILKEGRKVIIWCSFVDNMTIFENQLMKDLNPILIHGKISKETGDDAPEINREKLIHEFKEDPNPRVLIASTSALSESVSLHVNTTVVDGKEVRTPVCKEAIYLDRNFNGAQFMQSMDRIHRLGMDPKTIVKYYCLMGKDTIDKNIHDRLNDKYLEMGKALDDPWIQQLDYEGTEQKINEKQLEKDFEILVRHLRGITHDNQDS